MKATNIALKYMEIFFSGINPERLFEILTEDLIFVGPFYRFNSSVDYVNSLLADPPVNCKYKIIKIFENESMVNLIYEFSKPAVRTMMSQMFEFRNNKINKITLIFDTAAMTDNKKDEPDV